MARPTRSSPGSRKSSIGSFLLGVIIGLVMGLGIALAIAFYLNKTPIPFVSKAKPAAGKEDDAAKAPAIAGLPSGKASEKPRFDFYKILPGSEETVSDQQLKDQMRAGKGEPGADKAVYYLQAGAFQNPADADNQKARLAIIGFESSVEPASVPDKGTWYRVRLGPYTRVEDINRVRQALAQNGIDASLVKLKEAASTKAN
jgi:cell division protein FtsN